MSWIEPAFMAVVALGFGAYQLWSVNCEIRRDKQRAVKEETER